MGFEVCFDSEICRKIWPYKRLLWIDKLATIWRPCEAQQGFQSCINTVIKCAKKVYLIPKSTKENSPTLDVIPEVAQTLYGKSEICVFNIHTLGASTWPENRVRVEEMRNEFRIRSSMWKMINKPRGPYFTRWYRRVQCERVILKRGHFQVTYYMLIRLIWITYDIKNDSEMSLKL